MPPKYIHLKEKILAEYNIIYHINDCYAIKQLSSIRYNDQILFQKLSSKMQQVNLIIVDSIFPIILANLANEVFTHKISSFPEFMKLKKEFRYCYHSRETDYLRYKFKSFIHFLLYSNIATENVCNGDIETNLIYYFKNSSGEIEYFSIYDQHKLELLLLDKMRLEINLNHSSISNEEVTLNLEILSGI